MGHAVPILAKQFESDPSVFGYNIGNGAERTSVLRELHIIQCISKIEFKFQLDCRLKHMKLCTG